MSRRLRTDAERAAEAWRAAADSRPGFVTYPGTAAGDPSWWRRGGPVLPPGPVRLDDVGPAPVDGERCAKWCSYCHLDPEPAPDNGPIAEDFGPVPAPPHPALVELSRLMREPLPPRRRWWHRLTRRNP